MTTTNTIIKTALDKIYHDNPQFLFFLQRTDVEATLQDALDTVLPKDFSLATTKPDFEAIILQMTQSLQAEEPWKDIIPSGVGQTLLRNIAAGIGLLHFAITRATQVTYLQPGTPKESVYTAMSMLGVNPRRKVPGKVDVKIQIPDHNGSYTIPKFTQFTIEDQHFFNREDITYTEFELIKATTLVQGTMFTQVGIASGINYEAVEIGYENFAISDEDVYVFINNEEWLQAVSVPWKSKAKEKIFFVKTLETGNIQIMFGNDIFAKRLATNDSVIIITFETFGNNANNVITGTTFSALLDGIPLVGETTSSLYGMDNELPVDFYINAGPFLRSSEHGAVKRADYANTACRYPKIRDALFRFQAEIAPGKRNWMNVAEATVLTSDGMDLPNSEWEKFIAFMKDNSIQQIEFYKRNLVVIPIYLRAKVHCNSTAALAQIKSAMEAACYAHTSPRRGAIGYSVFKSDLYSLLEGKTDSTSKDVNRLIEYVTDLEVLYAEGFDDSNLLDGSGINAAGDIIADFFSYVTITTAEINTIYTPRRTNFSRRDLNFNVTT